MTLHCTCPQVNCAMHPQLCPEPKSFYFGEQRIYLAAVDPISPELVPTNSVLYEPEEKKLVAEYHHRPRTPDQGFQPYIVPEEQAYFEGEHLTPDGWQKVKTRDGAWISEQSTLGRFRVPLLTTEQILREPGWAKTQIEGFLVKNKTLLLWWYQPGKMQLNSQKEGLLFRGETPKTINEFRTLLKLLHI